MLSEDISVRQFDGEPVRRWFSDHYFDLIVSFDGQAEELGRIISFQLCYDKLGDERALFWTRPAGYTHYRVDTGEDGARSKRTPVFIPGGQFEQAKIVERFREQCTQIDQQIAQFVFQKISEYQPSKDLPPSAAGR